MTLTVTAIYRMTLTPTHSSEMKCDAAQPEGRKEAAAPAASPCGDTEETCAAETLAKDTAKLQHGEVVLARAGRFCALCMQ
jgi:hypothetical protein